MTFDDYQKQAMTTAVSNIHNNHNFSNFVYRTLGLAGEAGEVAEKVKKIIRDKDSHISEDDKAEIIKEMGDVLWYLQALADYLGVPFSYVAEQNLEKVLSRKRRNVTHGSGDNR